MIEQSPKQGGHRYEIFKAKKLAAMQRQAVEEALCFGWIDGKMFRVDEERFIIFMTPRAPGSVWSKNNRDRVEALMAKGMVHESGLEKIRMAQANGQWEKAYSARSAPLIPGDLLEALKRQEGALENFNGWTNSQQLGAIFWLDQAKRPQTRTKRIERIVVAAWNNLPLR
ncbi:MAG: YdeI/OmpD-associated family protein [Erysipelotrichaceae bacterium]|nr:YdeI/OmpD-associated family protein [Erysipelotrichaceae bacterium]